MSLRLILLLAEQRHSSDVEIIEAIGDVISKEIDEVGKVLTAYREATAHKDVS